MLPARPAHTNKRAVAATREADGRAAIVAPQAETQMIDEIFKRNKAWSDRIRTASPDFFPRLAAQQTPEYFWIGCSDSRVPANQVAGLDPGEVFVHRNVANVIHSADMNMLSVLEFAIFGLGVKEIMITGHYGCGGVRASLEDPTGALVDHWLEPVRRLSQVHAEELARAESHEAKVDRLCELNVLEGVRKLADSPIMREAWKRGLNIN